MAECSGIDIACYVKETGQAAVETGLSMISKEVAQAVEDVLVGLTTFWVELPPPLIDDTDGVTGFLRGYLDPLAYLAALCCVLIGAAKIMLDRTSESTKELAKGLAVLTVVASMSATLISMFAVASNAIGANIIDASLDGGNMGENMAGMMVLHGPLGVIATIALGFCAWVAGVIQFILMLVRDAALPIMAGVIVFAASFWGTEQGKLWLSRCVTVTVAFLIYQPAAAIIYASAFRRTGEADLIGSQGTTEQSAAYTETLSGIGTQFLAIFCLGALLGVAIPVAGKIAGRGGGAGTAAGIGLVGSVAGGAINNGSSPGFSSQPTPPRQETGSAQPSTSGAASTAATTAAGAATGGAGAVAVKVAETGAGAAKDAHGKASGALGGEEQ